MGGTFSSRWCNVASLQLVEYFFVLCWFMLQIKQKP